MEKNLAITDIEKLLKEAEFPNPLHKMELHKKIFEADKTSKKISISELNLDDLALAAGGKQLHPEQKTDTNHKTGSD